MRRSLEYLEKSVRPGIVAAVYLVTLSALGAPVLKAAVIAVVTFGLVMLPLGSRALQSIAVALLVCTLSIWIDVPPREHMAALANAVLHR